MRLINAETLEFEEFFRDRPPRMYYVLSHRWTEDEMTHRDFKRGRRKSSQGYAKVISYCSFARERHQILKIVREETPVYMRRPHMESFDSENDSEVAIVPENDHEWPPCYAWTDTCCIDKCSSAELSEAINSMYHYYAGATECHALLVDVTGSVTISSLPESAKSALLDSGSEYISEQDQDKTIEVNLTEEQDESTQLCSSVWFSRGWTLQELLAPKVVVFIDAQWNVIGHRRSKEPFSSIKHHHDIGHNLYAVLEKITGIDKGYLERPASVKHASVARRMSWASQRQVTRT